MHPAHFQAQQMSLNVFCSCGASGRPIQINLPGYLCLLDKTWHIGFYSPSAFKISAIQKGLGAITDSLFIGCDKILTHSPKPVSFKNWGKFFLTAQTSFFCIQVSLSFL